MRIELDYTITMYILSTNEIERETRRCNSNELLGNDRGRGGGEDRRTLTRRRGNSGQIILNELVDTAQQRDGLRCMTRGASDDDRMSRRRSGGRGTCRRHLLGKQNVHLTNGLLRHMTRPEHRHDLHRARRTKVEMVTSSDRDIMTHDGSIDDGSAIKDIVAHREEGDGAKHDGGALKIQCTMTTQRKERRGEGSRKANGDGGRKQSLSEDEQNSERAMTVSQLEIRRDSRSRRDNERRENNNRREDDSKRRNNDIDQVTLDIAVAVDATTRTIRVGMIDIEQTWRSVDRIQLHMITNEVVATTNDDRIIVEPS